MTLSELKDIHTHQPGRADALLSLPPEKAIAGYDLPYSLELHPWHLDPPQPSLTERAEIPQVALFLEAVEALRNDSNLLAIGECGLDNKCATPLSIQVEAFKTALSTAKELNLPVIIHCVGYWVEMMQCVTQVLGKKYDAPLVVHGFRKGPQLAHQLLNAGFSISLGKYYNPEITSIVPTGNLYWETDENTIDK